MRELQGRDPQLVIPKDLQTEAIHLVHEGHQGPDRTLALLREMCWFPNMNSRVREFVDTCRPCQASQPKMTTEPIKQIPYPDRLWQHLHANYKGP